MIHRDLPDDARRRLEHFQNVRFHDVGMALLERVAAVTAAYPALLSKAPIFYALEAFNLPGYNCVLKLDSDVLCKADATGLFEMRGALLACPDQPHYRHMVRHPTTYVPHAAAPATADDPPTTFNAGMLVLSPPHLGPRVYDDLLGEIRPETWVTVGTGHTDSIVLNRRFQHLWTRVPEKYNYFISNDTRHYTRRRMAMRDTAFLHFIGRQKPWHERQSASTLTDDYRLALAWWDEASASK